MPLRESEMSALIYNITLRHFTVNLTLINSKPQLDGCDVDFLLP